MLLEFEARGEEQEGEADLGEEQDRLVEMDPAEHRWPEDHAADEEEDDLGDRKPEQADDEGHCRRNRGDHQ